MRASPASTQLTFAAQLRTKPGYGAQRACSCTSTHVCTCACTHTHERDARAQAQATCAHARTQKQHIHKTHTSARCVLAYRLRACPPIVVGDDRHRANDQAAQHGGCGWVGHSKSSSLLCCVSNLRVHRTERVGVRCMCIRVCACECVHVHGCVNVCVCACVCAQARTHTHGKHPSAHTYIHTHTTHAQRPSAHIFLIHSTRDVLACPFVQATPIHTRHDSQCVQAAAYLYACQS